MPTIDLTNLTQPLFASPAGVADFANYVNHSSTFYSYLSTDGNLVTLLGSGFTVNGSNIPTGGAVTEVRMDLGNNNPVTPDMIVTGLTFAAMDLSYASGEAASYIFWTLMNQGDTEVLTPSDSVRLIGDSHDWNTGSLLGSDDILRGGDFTGTRLWGDVFDVTGGTVVGGDDSILGAFTEGHGDFGNITNAWVSGGDDLIRATQDVTNASIVTIGDGGFIESSVVVAGDDVIDLSAVSTVRGFLYGDIVDSTDFLNTGTSSFLIAGNDLITGTNTLVGDQIYGDGRIIYSGTYLAGDDTIFGGGGDDTISGDFGSVAAPASVTYGHDFIRGGTGNDSILGNGGNDSLYGDAGFDFLDGGDGDDYLNGGDQADNLLGGTGNDTMFGGAGFDRLFGQQGDDVLYGGDTFDSLYGQEDNDRLFGQNGNDGMWGGQGNDFLDGGADNDRMIGGAGFDTLLGSTGNDTMIGAFNADTFIFTDFGGGFGNDIIQDFAATNDLERIDLSRVAGIADFNDLVANHMNQIGSDVVIDDGSGNTITLQNVQLADLLDGNDFIF